MSLYAVAVVVGLAVAGVAVTVYFAVALYLVIPWKQIARLRRSPAVEAD
jgi:hypothetical protein